LMQMILLGKLTGLTEAKLWLWLILLSGHGRLELGCCH
jgi:hypothetical protein